MQVSETEDNPTKRQAPRGQEFAPMKVHVILDNSLESNLLVRRVFTDPEGPFQKALRVLSNGLMVRPIQGNITIPPTCTNRISFGPNSGKCQKGRLENKCGIFNVPKHLAGVQETCDGPFGPCSRSESSNDNSGSGSGEDLGVEADYVLFAGSLNSESFIAA